MMRNITHFLLSLVKDRLHKAYTLNPDVAVSKNKSELQEQLNLIENMLKKDETDGIIEDFDELSAEKSYESGQ